MAACLEVISPGLMTTVQDLGRIGHQAQGVPVSGALDMGHLRLANALVGNDEGQGALEIRILGPSFRVAAKSVRLALAGTEAVIEVTSGTKRDVPSGCSVTLFEGEEFRIGAVKDSAVTYLAVGGGFDLPAIYGSQSTYLSGAIGGVDGRALQAKDKLPLCHSEADEQGDRICTVPLDYPSGPVRVVLGPQDDYFSDEAIRSFVSQDYAISADANRMGLRLDGEVIGHKKGADISSDGIVTGAIQVPGNGLPIILLADHQTTGGYPKIACVASADIPRLGRMKPGGKLRFAIVSVVEAEEARRAFEEMVRASIASIVAVTDEAMMLERRLVALNLISGVVVE
ncbi:biotin-dependent carboxyltransferase family protein [uncultured Cohaesibacter sp.]|uniref:5-oxoprolinase subunit C family protein n=1 Tax=uncultured Cohaesibacter sp. TaxID=1002546 RepID=UPI0029C6EAD5|nr:biotin-dependent carboxyltransferase family protein [uncultured Cohaesibacter sp.]